MFTAFVSVAALAHRLLSPSSPVPDYWWAVLGAASLVMVMGMVDDRMGLSARYQTMYMVAAAFGVQLIGGAEGWVVFSQVSVPGGAAFVFPAALASLGTAFFLFVTTKTFDTIDGVDGLAAGLALISSLTLAALALYAGQRREAALAVAMAGCCVGFLKWNSAPARIFLAGGAQFVGFVLGCLAVVGPMKTLGPLGLLVPFTVFGVPVIDAFVVVLRRLKAKVHITQGDRRHTHHALLDAGLSKRQVVWVLYGVQAVLSGALLTLVAVFGRGAAPAP